MRRTVDPDASEGSMTRMRKMSALTVVALLGLSLAATGCGKYSGGALTAQKSYKDANALYSGSDWKAAAAYRLNKATTAMVTAGMR